MHTKRCNFINAALRVCGDIGKTYRKCLLRRSGQEMHVPNCEVIINHVKDRNLAYPIYYKIIKDKPAGHEVLTKPNYGGAHHYPSSNGDIR